jgi:PleD family two-component response regulator
MRKALENIRDAIAKEDFTKVGHKSCSIGATLYLEEEEIKSTIKRADEALYRAKESGRDQVVLA